MNAELSSKRNIDRCGIWVGMGPSAEGRRSGTCNLLGRRRGEPFEQRVHLTHALTYFKKRKLSMLSEVKLQRFQQDW